MSFSKAKTGQNKDSPLFLVLVVFFVLLGFWLLATSRSPSGKGGVAELSSKGVTLDKAMDSIDDKMKKSLLEGDLQRQRVINENEKLAPQVGPLRPENLVREPEYEYGLELNPGKSHGQQVLEDLGETQGPGYSVTPEQRIDAKLAREQWMEEYDRAFNKEYAQEFIENARRDGVEIELNENLEIISIRRVRDDNVPIRIPQSLRGRSGSSK